MSGIAVAAAACTGHGGPAGTAGAKGPEKPDLVVAVVPAEANAGLYIAQAEGLFAKVGLHVTIKPVVSAQAVIPAMLHGAVDVDGGGYVTYILAQAKGIAKVRILAAGFALGPHVNEIIALSKANIESPADLRGKTIAVNQLDSVASDLTYTALAPYGITPGQVHLVAMPFPAMPGALAAGKIDAAYETEPFVTEAVKKYGVEAVTDLDGGATQDLDRLARGQPGGLDRLVLARPAITVLVAHRRQDRLLAEQAVGLHGVPAHAGGGGQSVHGAAGDDVAPDRGRARRVPRHARRPQ